MDFIRTEKNGVVLFQVALSRATVKEAKDFKDILMEDINLGKQNIVIDFSSCEFIDSTFLGVIVTSQKKAIESLKQSNIKKYIEHINNALKKYNETSNNNININ